MARTRLYRDGAIEAEDVSLSEIARHLRDEGLTVWIDLGAPTDADLAAVADELGLHELAVEDAMQQQQRPKVDEYDNSTYLTAYAVALDGENAELTIAELGVFITDRAVVTVRPHDAFDIDAVVRRWDEMAHLARSGVGYLVHGLLDYVVDTHLDAVQSLDDLIEDFEDRVFDEKPGDAATQRHALALRRSLVLLRRKVTPMRDVLSTLLRKPFADQTITPYFQDVYDHALRAAEWTDALRDLVATIRETQLNIQSNRLNLIMKQVTGWAAIIAVPTAITGWYGQNVPFPGDGQPWGFVTSTVAIIVTGTALYLLFKRRDWL